MEQKTALAFLSFSCIFFNLDRQGKMGGGEGRWTYEVEGAIDFVKLSTEDGS
jgi:hypothetical protein